MPETAIRKRRAVAPRPHFLLLQEIVNWQDTCDTPLWDAGRDLYRQGADLLEDDADTSEETAREWLLAVYHHCLNRCRVNGWAKLPHPNARLLFERLVALLQTEGASDA